MEEDPALGGIEALLMIVMELEVAMADDDDARWSGKNRMK